MWTPSLFTTKIVFESWVETKLCKYQVLEFCLLFPSLTCQQQLSHQLNSLFIYILNSLDPHPLPQEGFLGKLRSSEFHWLGLLTGLSLEPIPLRLPSRCLVTASTVAFTKHYLPAWATRQLPTTHFSEGLALHERRKLAPYPFHTHTHTAFAAPNLLSHTQSRSWPVRVCTNPLVCVLHKPIGHLPPLLVSADLPSWFIQLPF